MEDNVRKFLLSLFLLISVTSSSELPSVQFFEHPTSSQNNIIEIELKKFRFRENRKYQEFPYNPLVSIELWNVLKPYFLPIDHQAKPALDRIFSTNRAIQSFQTFSEAGFNEPKDRGYNKIRLGKHRDLKGIVLKVYFDDQVITDEWNNWIRRIQGAEAIASYIREKKFTGFTVPKKWIYPLPETPSPPDTPEFNRKNFILVAENMNLKTEDETKKLYKKMSKKVMEQLFMIIRDVKLWDPSIIRNIPYTKNGDLSFIDTEYFHIESPINYERMARYFSHELRPYWQAMIKYGGPEFVPLSEQP